MRVIPGFVIFVNLLGVQSVLGAPGTANHQKSAVNRQTATVHIHLVSNFGIPLLGEVKVDVFQDRYSSNHVELAERFKGDVADGIPFGIYLLKIHARGFWSVEREVRVFQPHVLAVIAVEPGGIDGGLLFDTSTVGGKIQGAQSNTLHLRLTGVFSDTIMDAQANPDGTFEFLGVPHGTYILIAAREGDSATSSKGEVLFSRSVSVPMSSPLSVRT
jgi:hypothetical protein